MPLACPLESVGLVLANKVRNFLAPTAKVIPLRLVGGGIRKTPARPSNRLFDQVGPSPFGVAGRH